MTHPPGAPDPSDPSAPQDPWRTQQPEWGEPGTAYPQQPPPYGAAPPGHGGSQGRVTNAKAQAALWTGIGSLLLSCCLLGGLGGIAAVVLGVMGRHEIRASSREEAGDGMALAGIITGAVALVLSIALAVLLVVWIVNFGRIVEDGFNVDDGVQDPYGGEPKI